MRASGESPLLLHPPPPPTPEAALHGGAQGMLGRWRTGSLGALAEAGRAHLRRGAARRGAAAVMPETWRRRAWLRLAGAGPDTRLLPRLRHSFPVRICRPGVLLDACAGGQAPSAREKGVSIGAEKFDIRGFIKRPESEKRGWEMCSLVHTPYGSKGLRYYSQLRLAARPSRH